MALSVGQDAPELDVQATDGRRLRLSELRGKKNVVVYFYPGDFTPICTAETCGFRDAYEDLVSKDTEVIGISSDSDDSHRKFAAKYGVGFPLVSDADHAIANRFGAYGGLRALFGKTKRVTYVIDKQGKIAGVFDSELRASKHFDGVKELLDKLG